VRGLGTKGLPLWLPRDPNELDAGNDARCDSFCSLSTVLLSGTCSIGERKDRADPARGGTSSSGTGRGLAGRGRDPVGRAGRFVRRSARYKAGATCEYFGSQ